jgi:hypothetical protein
MTKYRRTAWSLPAGAVLALLCGAVLSPARAQVPPGSAGPAKIYTNRTVFDLPVNIAADARGQLREVVLFVKIGQAPWKAQDPVSPMQDRFRYKAAQDGEYWFSVVTVDRSGKASPADVSREPPGLMVIVDTQPPSCEVQMATLPSGERALRVLVQDNVAPDYSNTRVSAKSPSGTLSPLDPVPSQPGLFRATPEVLGGWIQVVAADRAGNRTTRDINLRDMLGQGVAGGPAPQSPAPAPSMPAPASSGTTHTAARTASMPGLSGPTPQPSLPTPPAQPGSQPSPASSPTASASDARPGAPVRQVINTKHASIDYRVEPTCPSGISKVEVWMTADQGASWQKAGEDMDRRSPAEVDLPGEGLFGIRLAVRNGNGFGGAPPTANDTPHAWVEVDLTPPAVQLHEVEPTSKDGKLEIRWVVNDKNLTATPINLYYATRREGPWQPIAQNVKNDGFYQWAFPHDAGNQFFVRLEATDQAGNVARRETPSPVVLDMTEPHALVVGVSGVNPTPPQGH